jgi:hypothetical protein
LAEHTCSRDGIVSFVPDMKGSINQSINMMLQQ